MQRTSLGARSCCYNTQSFTPPPIFSPTLQRRCSVTSPSLCLTDDEQGARDRCQRFVRSLCRYFSLRTSPAQNKGPKPRVKNLFTEHKSHRKCQTLNVPEPWGLWSCPWSLWKGTNRVWNSKRPLQIMINNNNYFFFYFGKNKKTTLEYQVFRIVNVIDWLVYPLNIKPECWDNERTPRPTQNICSGLSKHLI